MFHPFLNSKQYLFVLLCVLFSLLSCHKEDALKGIDKSALFASPTQAELEAVKTVWKSRDLAVKGFRLEQMVNLSETGPSLQFVSFMVDNYREYGALIIPAASKPLPVYLFINGFSNENPVNYNTLVIDTSQTDHIPFIYAIPALRGQTLILNINGKEYRSPQSDGPHSDAFDGATDDAIAFLNIIHSYVPQADLSKGAVRGGSRGGTVALLMAERDERVRSAIGVAFPSELISLTASHQNDPTYKNHKNRRIE